MADPDDVAVRQLPVCTGLPFTVVPLVEPRSDRWPCGRPSYLQVPPGHAGVGSRKSDS